MSPFERLIAFAGALALGVGLVVFALWVSVWGAILAVAFAIALVLAVTFERTLPEANAGVGAITPDELEEARAEAERIRALDGAEPVLRRGERREIVARARAQADTDADVDG